MFYLEAGEIKAEAGYWTLVPQWYEKDVTWVKGRTGNPSLRLKEGQRVHFNSRVDTLTSSLGWQRYLKENRCIAFLSHYFEWSDEEMLSRADEKSVGKFWVKDQDAFPVAGIYSYIPGPDGAPLMTFSIITTDPNKTMAGLPHHRMPAILDEPRAKAWLAPDTAEPHKLLTSFPDEKMDSHVEAAGDFYRLLL